MVYVSIGMLWCLVLVVIGDFSLNQMLLERSFINLGLEILKFYEGGFWLILFDGWLILNVIYYYQLFKNYFYCLVQVVFFVSMNFNMVLGINFEVVLIGFGGFNFVVFVFVKVDGVEVEVMFQVMQCWNIGVNIFYMYGCFSGVIFCNDYNLCDGKFDVMIIVLIVVQVRVVIGGDNFFICNVIQLSNQVLSWSGIL